MKFKKTDKIDDLIPIDVSILSSCVAMLASNQSDTTDSIFKIMKELRTIKKEHCMIMKRLDKIERNSN